MKIAWTLAAVIILFCLAPPISAQKIQSQYTDLIGKKCKTLEENPGMYILEQCPGIGGYKLKLADVDLRQSLTVVAPAGKEYDLDFDTPNFSHVGNKAEWRVKKLNGKIVPVALIVRFYIQDNPDNYKDETAYLMVMKINADEVCPVDKIKSSAQANKKARQSADDSSGKNCLKKER
ncbi:MAG: hypothetical protein M3T96_01205 [Acidobacteriota bacterium]|nr:hypothetical protein [Acidobacteriota bacterium]